MELKSIKVTRAMGDFKKVGVQSSVLRKSIFDTENVFYYYFTELRKEQYSR